MKRFAVIPTLAVLILALAPAAALADLYVNGGRSPSGGPAMARDPNADMPRECRRYSEDSVVCATYVVGELGKIHFVTVHDFHKWCDVYVGARKDGGVERWTARVGHENGVRCVLTWKNENTVTVHAI